jgi:hypothetical protein
MRSTPSPYKVYVKDYLKLSEPMKLLIAKWKNILATRYKNWGTRWLTTKPSMTSNQIDISKTPVSQTSNCPSGQDFTYQPNGSNASTPETSHVSQLTTVPGMHHTLSQSTHPPALLMTPQWG